MGEGAAQEARCQSQRKRDRMFERTCIAIAITAVTTVYGGLAYAHSTGAIEAAIVKERAALCQAVEVTADI
jgi:hypothetical protein